MTTILHAENHLEPVGLFNDEYSQAVFKALIPEVPEGEARVWMIVLPSFQPEYSVIIKQHYEWDKSSPDEELWDVTNTTYSVAKVIAKDKIWKWKELDDRWAPDISPTNSVIQYETEVSEEFAKYIQNAWLGVLKQTRHPEEDIFGADGVTYYFYSHYLDYFGKTWSPEEGLPYELVQLGNKLGELASSEEENGPCIKEECRSLAINIINETKGSNNKGIDAHD